MVICRLLVGVAPNGNIMLTQKTGAGSLQAESIADMLTVSCVLCLHDKNTTTNNNKNNIFYLHLTCSIL